MTRSIIVPLADIPGAVAVAEDEVTEAPRGTFTADYEKKLY
jgi:hypothetical protein